MEKLNLPIVKGALPRGKRLTMDEYLEFVQFGLTLGFDRRAYRKTKKRRSVKVPFTL